MIGVASIPKRGRIMMGRREDKYTEEQEKWIRAWFREHEGMGTQAEVVPIIEDEFRAAFGGKRNGLALWNKNHRMKQANPKDNGRVEYVLLIHNGDEMSGGKVTLCTGKPMIDRKIEEATVGTCVPPHVVFTRAKTKVTVEIVKDE